MSQSKNACPLCFSGHVTAFSKDNRREYFCCGVCSLVFVPSSFWLSDAEEKAQYDLHENNPLDLQYQAFLNKLAAPLLERLPEDSKGLDFGCGPGPTLSLMLAAKGHSVDLYDKFFYPDESYQQRSFDFITATEVVEHLHDPRKVLDGLWSQLNMNGHLGLMTKRVVDRESFSRWHYKNDPTHIIFFHMDTFLWLENYWQAELSIVGSDVVIFKKV